MDDTPNYNLKKPAQEDFYNVKDFNDNADIIDKALNEIGLGTNIIEELQTEEKTLSGAINELKNKKVDKIAGKHLSDMNYTIDEKMKLAGIETNANNYVHPITEGNKHIPDGGTLGNFLKYSSAGTAVWAALAKIDVELDSVENYEIATKVEAEAGTSNVKYMTPMRVREALDSANSWKLINRITTVATSRIDVILPYYKEYMIIGRDFAFPNTATGAIEAIFNDDVSNVYFGNGIEGSNIKISGARNFIQIVPTMRNESQPTPSRFNFIMTILNNIGGKNTNIAQLISEHNSSSMATSNNLIYKYMNSAIINKVSILHKALQMLADAELEIWGR